MDQVETPTEKVDEIQIADAVALFNEALKLRENDREAAQELFEKSFDGMMELALGGDIGAQHNVAVMYEEGVGEPYDEDISVFLDWTLDAEEDLQAYLDNIDEQIHDILGGRESDHHAEPIASDLDDTGDSVDHDKESRKLRRLYLLKARLERQGFKTGANRDEYPDADND